MVDVISALREELDSHALLLGEDVRTRGTGWGRTDPCVARAVVRPRTTEEVAKVLRLCHEAGQAVVVQGGLTGLVEGAVPMEEEIALSLERMTEIEEVDEVGRTMTVQSGVPLQTIQERAEEAGLIFPLDLGARGSCTIGGNVATNAGGNRVIRFGMTRDMVLGLEAVLADGTVLTSLNRMIKNNAGYDLKHLFIGSEGTLGVVTRVVLRLWPKPRSHNTALVAVSEFDRVISLLRAVEEGLGASLSAFEVMWREFYELVTTPPAEHEPPLGGEHPYYVLIEALGSHQEVDSSRFEEELGRCLEEGLVADAVLAQSRSERERLWALRDDVEQLFRLAPTVTFDVSLPIRHMEEYVARVKSDLAATWSEPRCVVFGHLGDGNLHLVIGVGDAGARRRIEEIVYSPLEKIGGSISAEHGIGLQKRPHLPASRSRVEIQTMRSLKEALDPRGILNPGRVLPPR